MPEVATTVRVRTIPIPTPFPVGPVNVHLIENDPITLVDTGPHTDEAWEALRDGLKTAGLSVFDIKRVLLTHGHQDHYGLAGKIADTSGATLLGGRLDRRHFKMERPTERLLERLARGDFGFVERLAVMAAVTAVDHYARPLAAWDELSGGEVLPGDGYTIEVQSTPGHTPGSLTFNIPESGVLFTGDTVLRDITPNAIVDEDPEAPGETFRSLSRYFESLDDISDAHSGSRLLTGHGSPIPDYDAHREGVDVRYRQRLQSLADALASGPKTVRQLVAILFPHVKTLNIYLAYSEILGILMYLEDQGQVEKIEERNLDRYRLLPPGTGAGTGPIGF
jgi:glyoxylase-like metal-dependent hydrolase (beta-lactamase superfamily II)